MNFIEKARLKTADRLQRITNALLPRQLKSVGTMHTKMMALISKGIQEQEAGGLVYAGWSLTEEGAQLATRLERAVESVCARVRADFYNNAEGDQPVGYTETGRPVFDNTPTVVVVVACNAIGELLIIRRDNEPGKGKLALPGGYHMKGETWREAGAREVLEETGYHLDPQCLEQVGVVETDEYGNNLMIAKARFPVSHTPDAETDREASEVMFTLWAGTPDEWAFPRHYAAAIAEIGGANGVKDR